MAQAKRIESKAAESEPRPRTRILATARDLFYRDGIRAVGVEVIAAEAGTNKMTLYRNFGSKEELIAEYLRGEVKAVEAHWDNLVARFPNDPKALILAWLKEMGALMTRPESRGCPMVNAAVELPDPAHPGRKVIEQHKSAMRDRLAAVCRKAGLAHPELLADQIHMLVEGAGVCLQSVGPDGPSHRLVRIVESLLDGAEKAPRRR
ncbi:TetR/AcrR family transcriptional regulator [Dongia sedimenti]|uniref:TetR/AcrR family transcriptional regulator n=1 Tax=Dongia sedimenti TaxID=3064282 RepID=A0ABU0YQZ0_9PROT|nr:TetR/AcrR family transcriptional regulator [Rhodospirillaceae bacterium R-7]